MSVPFIQSGFAAGEISPALWGGVSLAKFSIALATCRNAFVDYRGGIKSRPGTALVALSPQTFGTPPRLIRFQFSLTQGIVLEFGNLYLRFIENGGYVLSGGTPYQISTPYRSNDLHHLKFAQSADVMSITCSHPISGVEYPPYDLKRLGATSWTLTATTFASAVPAPTGAAARATVTPSGSLLPTAFAYVVTAVDPSTGEESVASNVANVTNSVDIAATAGSIVVSWTGVVLTSGNQPYYNVYKAPPSYNSQPGNVTNANPVPIGALFGLLSSTQSTQFVDTNFTADLTQTPPLHQNPFAPGAILAASLTSAGSSDFSSAPTVTVTTSTGSGAVFASSVSWGTGATGSVAAVIVENGGGSYGATDTASLSGGGGTTEPTLSLSIGPQSGTYPGVVGYFQQRRIYAASLNNPDTFWASRPGMFTNFDASIPPVPDDAITATPWSVQVNGIQWLVQMPNAMLVFTGAGAWQVTGSGSYLANLAPITPTNTQAVPQAAVGCNETLPPIPVNYDVIYVTSKGYSVRDLVYTPYVALYYPRDISILSTHLLEGHTLIEWAWAEEPNKVLWAVRDDGVLLSLTYLQEQEVYGWARHDTQGYFRSICSVTEPPVDAVYVVVERTINGAPTYVIERMDNRLWTSVEDCWCVDSAVAYLRAAPSADLTISGTAGSVTLTADSSVFTSGDVGQVVRASGGIFTVTAYSSGTSLTANVVKAPMALPDWQGSGGVPVFKANSGSWTIAAPVTSVSGLSHLTGQTVTGLADGIPVSGVVAAGGVFTLPFAASAITLGLPFQVEAQSVYANPPGPATAQGKRKNLTDCAVRVAATGWGALSFSSYGQSDALTAASNQPDGAAQSPIAVAPAWSGMTPLRPSPNAAAAAYQSPAGQTVTPLFTGDFKAYLPAEWRKPGQLAVAQNAPLPLNLTAFVPDLNPGDLPEAGVGEPAQGQQRSRGPGPWMLAA